MTNVSEMAAQIVRNAGDVYCKHPADGGAWTAMEEFYKNAIAAALATQEDHEGGIAMAAEQYGRQAEIAAQKDAWQPIETAPSACHVLAARFDDCEWVYHVAMSPPGHPFTHWRPLPAPPPRPEQ